MDGFKRILLKIENMECLKSIKRGLTVMIPIFLIGSLVLLFIDSPFNEIEDLMMSLFGESWHVISEAIYRSTFEIMSIFVLISVSYYYGSEKNLVKVGEISIIIIAINALSAYSAYNYIKSREILLSNTGPAAIFKAMIIAIAATWVFIFFYRILQVKTRKIVSKISSSNVFKMAIYSIIPAFLTIFVFAISGLFLADPGFDMIIIKACTFISNQSAFDATGFYVVISQLLWGFGIHGANIAESFANGVKQLNPALNILPLVGGGSSNKTVLDSFVYIGGAGSTLGLVIAILLQKTRSPERNIAKLSSFFSIFNINEILIYGLPIIFNPYYLIPFILTPLVLFLVTNFAITIGFIVPLAVNINWTTPVFISGYLLTGSVTGIMLQLFNLMLAVLIYTPFVSIQNENRLKSEKLQYHSLLNELIINEGRKGIKMINRDDDIGGLFRSLVVDFNQCLEGNNSLFHLEYQPKADRDMNTIGAETLIRCVHPDLGEISPLVIVNICDEAGMTNKLGTWVIKHAFYDIAKIHEELECEIPISINLDPRQLRSDEELVVLIQKLIGKWGVNPKMIELELTENAHIDSSEKTLKKIEFLKKMGIIISLDDFTMGHSSLTYLNSSYIDVVKLDAKLVRNIDSDEQLQQVTEALINLCQKLDISIIAEGIETRNEFETLKELNCLKFQGYYFSRPLKPKDFIDYVNISKQ